MNMQILSEYLDFLEIEKGLSQNQLAEKLEISREHLAKIETAKRCVSLGLLIDIAEKLNIPVKDFFDF